MAQNSFTQYCRQEADTAALAQKLASSLGHLLQADQSAHLNISLEGDLGAGKTTFARHLIQGLGYEGRVKSPTYTLCEPYPLEIHGKTLAMNHFDLYRMRDPLEWQEAGFAEHFDEPGFCLVEWLPAYDIEIRLIAGTDENERNVILQANSSQGMAALERMHIQ
jgi:tRNA threonylcarbamoyladenosine biosynthesis protein TsaE